MTCCSARLAVDLSCTRASQRNMEDMSDILRRQTHHTTLLILKPLELLNNFAVCFIKVNIFLMLMSQERVSCMVKV